MKPVIKYPVTLLIILLMGYSQVFAHLSRGNAAYSAGKQLKGVTSLHTPVDKKAEFENVNIFEEDENDRVYIKHYAKDNITFSPSYAKVPDHFFEATINVASSCQYFSCFSFFRPPYLAFRVFRL